MDYIDNQAEESEGESSDTSLNDEPIVKKRKVEKKVEKDKKKKKKKQIESSDEDDDEDDDAKAAEEMKDFIADGEDEEGDGDDDDDKSEKSERMEEELDEDDLDLIEENLDHHPKRRIVQMSDSEDEDDRTAIKKKLFGDDDEGEGPSVRNTQRDYEEERHYSDSEQSEDNFIVNEDGDRPMHRHRHRKGLNMPEGALEEARDIFGVEDFNLDEFYDEDDEGIDEEDEEIMDEEGEGIPMRRQRTREKKSTLLDTMEPSELERGYLAPQDKKIQLEDRPERFQLRRTPINEADEAELEIECKWIFKTAFQDTLISRQPSRWPEYLQNRSNDPERHNLELHVTNAIKETLRFIRNQLFEVPFIAFYRKEQVADYLTLNELWRVYEYDEKYCHLQNRKNKLLDLMRRMQTYQMEGEGIHRRPVSEADIHELHGVESQEALADVYSQFQLYYGADITKMQEWEKIRRGETDELPTDTRFKQSSRNDKYQFCVENGIDDFVSRFGLNAREFAENLDWKRHEVGQDDKPIMHAAEEYVTTVFQDPETVKEAAIFMMAKEISRQPLARERIRKTYRQRAVISVKPTKKGREQLDDSSPVWTKRYISNKPIAELENDEYLLYHKYKCNGILEVKISCDSDLERDRKETLADMVLMDGPFKRDEFSELVEDWNHAREKAVRKAVDEMLIPYFEGELHQQLLDEAKHFVAEECAKNLEKRVEMAGYRPNKEDIEEDEDFRAGDVRVMAVAFPSEFSEASFGAVVDQDGNVLDYVRMVHFLKRSQGEGAQQKLKEESMGFFKKMVERKRPHIVGLCSENMEALRLKRDLEDALEALHREGAIHFQPNVVFLDNEVAKVYMNSKQAMAEFPDYPPILRQAVSAARTLVDPLIEVSHLWNQDDDIFCLHFHPLQSELGKDQLSRAITREMINRVNDVGVDINRCLDNPHHCNLVQFIAGLGPRKAVNLLKIIKQHDHLLETRTKLVTMARMGPKVFMNCAGFIKIDTAKVSERTEQYVEVLDGTRVHPETYDWARKMAVDALEVDDNADPTAALEEILDSPDRLRDLDLDAFADELNRQGFGEKKSTLYDISSELHHRYNDRRRHFEPLNQTDVCFLVSRDSKDLLKEGRLVQGTVFQIQYKKLTDEQRQQVQLNPSRDEMFNQWTCEFCNQRFTEVSHLWDHTSNKDVRSGGCTGQAVGVRVRLENGFTGFIPNKMISDNPKSFRHPLERVQLNKPIWCRILKVEPEKFSCLLSCRTSDLKSEDASSKDRYWDGAAEENDKETDEIEKKSKQQTVTINKRVIQHPSFFNVTYHDAQRLLGKLEQGDAVIRPSSKAPDRLTVTWKVAEKVYCNVDVQEEEKEHAFALGKRLIIGNEEYEDLNEILARYIQPMAGYARDIVLYKYYLDNLFSEDTKEIETKLREERRKAPSRVPYFLTASAKFPGKFVLSYVPPNVRGAMHEYMTVTPEGIRFRKLMFPSFDRLLGWFKEHYNELPQVAPHSYSRR